MKKIGVESLKSKYTELLINNDKIIEIFINCTYELPKVQTTIYHNPANISFYFILFWQPITTRIHITRTALSNTNSFL